MDATEYFSPAATAARHDKMRGYAKNIADCTFGFAEQMDVADARIRRERRPLPAHDLNGLNYRRWAAAVLQAEIKHARDDFWRAVHDTGLAMLFHRDGADRDADVGFRFPHEAAAGVAAVWLSHLTTHDGIRHGVWSRWLVMSRDEKISWARRKREMLHGFLGAMRFYQAARAKIDAPLAVAA